MKKLIVLVILCCLVVSTTHASKDANSRNILEMQIEIRELRKKNEYLHTRVDSLFALLYYLGERVSQIEDRLEGMEESGIILPMHARYRETQ